jgi:hypothetical protein
VQKEKGFSLYFVQKEFAKLFGEKPVIRDATREEKQSYLDRVRAECSERGYKPARASVLYKQVFGEWPS